VTIRYYGQMGLMPAPSRTEGNYRASSQEHIRGLRFIRRCRDLGFTLEHVRELFIFPGGQAQQVCRGDYSVTLLNPGLA
jgi:DNA-binding transcriptional MerR regulator